jgi:hypothetical protein
MKKYTEIIFDETDFTGSSAGDILNRLVESKRADRPDMSFSAAFSDAQIEYPELALRYADELRTQI